MEVTNKVVGAIGIVIVVVVLLSMTSVVIDQVMAIMYGTTASGQNASAWNFTGHSGAESVLGLVPFVWIASILIAAAVGMFALAKS